jgi:TolB-like protein
VVEEANINQTIFALRRALQADGPADRYIVTAPTKGYRFVAPVRFELDPACVSAALPEPAAPVFPPPNPWWRGRSVFVAAILAVATLACSDLLIRSLSTPKPPESAAQAPFAPPPHSVAVLAFTNMSGDPAQDYFSDGISEELINALSRVDALRVVARTSSFSFKGKQATIADIARQLNVGAVLEGSVRRDGTRVRITAELVNATTGFELWSGSYDRDQSDMLRLQGEIGQAVATSLQVTLLADQAAGLTVGGSANPRAFDAYLRGLQHIDSWEVPSNKAALAAFDEAIALDANFALAYKGRSIALMRLASYEENTAAGTGHTLAQSALDAADRAIALAPTLARAHMVRGQLLGFFFSNWPGAAAELSRGLALAPGDRVVQSVYGEIIQLRSPSEALPFMERGAALDPLSPTSWGGLAFTYMYLRRYDDALAAFRHAEQLQPDADTITPGVAGIVEFLKGDPEAARRDCAADRGSNGLECLAIAYQALHMPTKAAAALAALQAMEGDAGAVDYAQILAQWGRIPEAVKWLQTAFRVRKGSLMDLRVDPLLDPVRDTPEYKDIESKMTFPPL